MSAGILLVTVMDMDGKFSEKKIVLKNVITGTKFSYMCNKF